MPHRKPITKLFITAGWLLLALQLAWLYAQTAGMPAIGNMPQMAGAGPYAPVSGSTGYSFGQHLDTVLSVGGMSGLAGRQFAGATFFHPSFQKMGRHYGLLTILIRYPNAGTGKRVATARPGGTAAVYAQRHRADMVPPTPFRGSGNTFFHPFTKELGKGYAMLSVYIRYDGGEGEPKEPVPAKIPFLQLHGNIAYTFDYRSRLDTPFAATDLQQHNEQVYADAVFKGRYPFRVVLNSRQSNSPYFKGYTDVALQFDRDAFRQKVRQELVEALNQKLRAAEPSSRYEALAKIQQQKWAALKSWLESPARRQEAVQERELAYKEAESLER